MPFASAPDLLKGWRILVVDDEPDNLEIAQTLLECCGAVVLTAVDGAKGLEQVRQGDITFIIADLSMPEMNGWEMLAALQANPATSSIPVIALTAHAMPGDREQALRAGFHNYLAKPLVPKTFIADLLSRLIDIPAIALRLRSQV